MDFRAGADEDEARGDVGVGFPEDVGAFEEASGWGAAGAVEGGDVLASEDEEGGAIGLLEGLEPGDGGFVGISGANEREARDSAHRGKVLDGLVCGAIFADEDGIVREDVDGLQFA